eukprot:scaffold15125_cov41-Prasinocladus_malaysianus.AAC.1
MPSAAVPAVAPTSVGGVTTGCVRAPTHTGPNTLQRLPLRPRMHDWPQIRASVSTNAAKGRNNGESEGFKMPISTRSMAVSQNGAPVCTEILPAEYFDLQQPGTSCSQVGFQQLCMAATSSC